MAGYSHRTAQPPILAVFLPWGVSAGAGRIRPANAKIRVMDFLKNSFLTFLRFLKFIVINKCAYFNNKKLYCSYLSLRHNIFKTIFHEAFICHFYQ